VKRVERSEEELKKTETELKKNQKQRRIEETETEKGEFSEIKTEVKDDGG